MKIVYEKDNALLKERVVEKLHQILSSQKDNSVLLLLSGGSVLQLLSGQEVLDLTSKNTIGVLDERYSLNDNINNFSQLTKTSFYSNAQRQGCHFIDTRVKKGESCDQLANRFDKQLHEWKKNNPEGRVIITQGIGPDGHTSGIMPYPEDPDTFNVLFKNKNKWVIGYDAESKNQYSQRATTTISFLAREVDHSLVYVAGDNKKGALLDALNPKTKLFHTPAAVIQKMKDVILFTNIFIT